jgi:hypothetical protein
MSMTLKSSARADNAIQQLTHSFAFQVVLFCLAHIPLAYVLRLSGRLGMLHALLVLAFGIRAAFRQDIGQVVCALGYLAGAEILWRMTGADIFWEFSKYAAVLIAFLAIMIEQRDMPVYFPKLGQSYETPQVPRYLNLTPLFYFALLLPATILTWLEMDFNEARQQISFNLSGPLALAIMALYLWKRPLNKQQIASLLVTIIAPITGVLFHAVYSTFTAEVIFTLESNFTTSGGYGPNQVSNILGLGALAAIFLLIVKWRSPGLRLFLLLLAATFVLQAFLTFSRGGVISLFIAVLLLGLHLFRTPQARGRFLFLAVIAYGTGVFIITPILDGFTDTLWQQRFADLSTTGRSEVALADWQAFLEYPLVGTGVGLSREYHQLLAGISVTAHTEVTRMLAEHGLLGVLSLCILVAMIGYSYVKAKAGVPRAFTSTFIAWALFVMLQSAMRFLAIPLSLTLAMVVWQVSLDDAPWKGT